MVSMVETSISNHNDMAMDQVAPKSEPLNEGSISSSVSTPDPEGEVLTQDVAQTQKRKGGRKPVRKNHLHLGVDVLLYGSPWVISLSPRIPATYLLLFSFAGLISLRHNFFFFYLAPWSVRGPASHLFIIYHSH